MSTLSPRIKKILQDGTVIPAHPLVLDQSRQLDEDGQKLLTKYYLASGAGGIAIGVHTTQFAIRDPKYNLFEKVLRLGISALDEESRRWDTIKIAGISGEMTQACEEAKLARELGYDLVLVSTNGLAHLTEQQLIERARAVAEIIPIFGFYLQPAVGGRVLPERFWKDMAAIPNLHAIKIAPFNRYQTLDVVKAVAESGRSEEIALYTGNDDNILLDLLTSYEFGNVRKEIVGGLLGHWAVWTSKAVKLLQQVKAIKIGQLPLDQQILLDAQKITDSNAAFFDARNNFAGCIAGIHEVLRRQGLIQHIYCLDPEETLSPGQAEEIDRVYASYPELNDDIFVRKFLQEHTNP